MADTGSRITRVYGNFRGIDLRGEECALTRSPDCKNVWRNYKDLASIETRPGLEIKWALPGFYGPEKINKIIFYKNKPVVMTDRGLFTTYMVGDEEKLGLSAELFSPTFVFEFAGYLYLFSDHTYYRFDGIKLEEVEPYIPTTSIGRTPAGEGTAHEDINILTNRRKNEFTPDGESAEYHLDTPNGIESYWPVEVWSMAGNYQYKEDEYSVDYANGIITFLENENASHIPEKFQQDNIRVIFTARSTSNNRISWESCDIAQVFDNRVFFAGSSTEPNRLRYSKLNAPNYISDVDYVDDGKDGAKIKGIVPGNNAFWVFREPNDSRSNIFYHVPSIDDVDGKIYPSSSSSVSLGCVGSAINFNDDIVFFSSMGMEGISSDITTEQFASHRSSVVDRLMTAHKNYKNMILAEWQGYLVVFLSNNDADNPSTDVYLADSRAVYQNESHMEYEWYYWQIDHNVSCAVTHDDVLYIGTDEGNIFSLTDMDDKRAIESYWTTPKDKFNTPQKTKTTNKRGCVVEAEGDIMVYAKTEDTEYEPVGTFNDVKDYIAPRIKQKKFKDLQLKFESDTSFKLESVTIEAVVGGYIKR